MFVCVQVSGSFEGKYELKDYKALISTKWSTSNILASKFEFQVIFYCSLYIGNILVFRLFGFYCIYHTKKNFNCKEFLRENNRVNISPSIFKVVSLLQKIWFCGIFFFSMFIKYFFTFFVTFQCFCTLNPKQTLLSPFFCTHPVVCITLFI